MSIYIGIDASNNDVYEGAFKYGHLMWPVPIISPATFVDPNGTDVEYPKRNLLSSFLYIFREDGFDPVSRTRRGRFYKIFDQPLIEWTLDSFPSLVKETNDISKNQQRKLIYTFTSSNIQNTVKRSELDKTMIHLGTEDQFSIWSIVNLESIVTGEDLVTLRMRPTMGILPNINSGLIPAERRETIQRLLDKFSNEVYRSAPESVIDRARDAASAILGAYNEHNRMGSFEKDLGKQIKALEKSNKRIAVSCSNIVRIFHARAKPSEQERHNLRPITEQDAELAVNCIGTILCEIGWARWM